MKSFFSKVSRLLAASLLVGGLSLAWVVDSPVAVSAQSNKDAVCDGIGMASGSRGCDDAADSVVGNAVQTAIRLLSWIVGIASVIMVIVGGFKYVLSSGDSANTSSAKNTILYALIGLVVAILAQVIVNFVVGAL